MDHHVRGKPAVSSPWFQCGLALAVGCSTLGQTSTDQLETIAEANLADAGPVLDSGIGKDGGVILEDGNDAAMEASVLPKVLSKVAIITDQHRFIDGKMFGGWGPHLGHLVRTANKDAWFVDDICMQSAGASACDVEKNHTLGFFRLRGDSWSEALRVSLPPTVQQNTATVVHPGGAKLLTFGINIATSRLVQCTMTISANQSTCETLPFPLDAASNYVGAAVTPNGAVVVWWTNVVDGGGGGFHYLVDYGGGWNGPRSGGAGSYNDAAYTHVAFGFGKDPNAMTWHAQVVSGLSPNWVSTGLTGESNLAQTTPVVFANSLSPHQGDTMASTNDLLTDPVTGDVLLVARSSKGQAVFYEKRQSGWSAATFALPSYRVRFLRFNKSIAIVYSVKVDEVALRIAPDDLPRPIAWASLPEYKIALPSGFGAIFAIYPEAPMYQNVPSDRMHFALVGSTRQNQAVSVEAQVR
jgi:hypothetical protein